MNQFLRHAASATGLAVIAWVGAGYLLTNPLALVLTLLIGAFYVMGVLELRRFRQATDALASAVDALAATPASLAAWLEPLPAGLRNAVRRRIEGEPVGLPGPALAPMLAGLLVLLGMLGTFLGMILTLRGTGAALETATDLVAVRNSLIAPVKGLGLAFGTSVAGVAASAALGFLAALARRERVAVAQRLDARIATTLRPFSVSWQREAQLGLLQRQAELMPALVEGLNTMMATLERQAEASQARLLASQERFQGQAEAAYTTLAQSVDRTLQASLTDGARIAGETIRPVAEATLAGIARETATLHATLAGTMQEHVAQLSSSFAASTAHTAESWQALLARHEQSAQALAASIEASHARFAQTFEQRATTLLDDVAQRHAGWQGEMATALAGMARDTAALQQSIAGTSAAQLDGAGARLDAAVERVTQAWADAVARQQEAGARLADANEQSLSTAAATFERHSASLLQTVQQAHVELQASSAARDQQRVDAMAQSLEAMAASLQAQWQQAGAQSLEQQQRVVETMERTARDITQQAETQARATIAEIGSLVAAASASWPASACTRSWKRWPTRSSTSADDVTSASIAPRCSPAARLTPSSRVPSVSRMRARSSSIVLSRAMLSESFWRSSEMTSAAARGASDAACTRRAISAIVARACVSACTVISRAVRSIVSTTRCCCSSDCAPACCHSRRSAAAIASIDCAIASTRCWSRAAASAWKPDTICAAARGASDAASTRRPISAIVERACVSACTVISRAVRSIVSTTRCCCSSDCAPACCHCCCSDAAIASSEAAIASTRCWSRAADAVCNSACARSTVRSNEAECCSNVAAAPASDSPVAADVRALAASWRCTASAHDCVTRCTASSRRAATPSTCVLALAVNACCEAAVSRAIAASAAAISPCQPECRCATWSSNAAERCSKVCAKRSCAAPTSAVSACAACSWRASKACQASDALVVLASKRVDSCAT